MPKVSLKRQITLPVRQCLALGIEPGDEVESFVSYGQLTIVKKKHGAARGALKHIQGNPSMTDEESMESSLQ